MDGPQRHCRLDPDIAKKFLIRRDMGAFLGPLPPLKFV